MRLPLTIIALAVLTVPAIAQTFPIMPEIVPLTDLKGKAIGTAAINGNRTYLRNLQGELTGTIENTPDGATLYDPNGKVLDFKARPKSRL